MSLDLARARVRGRLGAEAAPWGRFRGVGLGRAAFSALGPRLLIGTRELDRGVALPLVELLQTHRPILS
jgi:hypothetical protein